MKTTKMKIIDSKTGKFICNIEEIEQNKYRLIDTDLRYANLSNVNLSYADLSYADLSYANLEGADIKKANFFKTNLEGVKWPFDWNHDPHLKQKIYDRINSGKGEIDMHFYHTCSTVHCIAGWACVLHPDGKRIENESSTYLAGRLLLGLSANETNIFVTSDEKAMEWLKN